MVPILNAKLDAVGFPSFSSVMANLTWPSGHSKQLCLFLPFLNLPRVVPNTCF